MLSFSFSFFFLKKKNLKFSFYIYIYIYIYIHIRDEKMWENSRKNVFHNFFKNTTKHLKIFFGSIFRNETKHKPSLIVVILYIHELSTADCADTSSDGGLCSDYYRQLAHIIKPT